MSLRRARARHVPGVLNRLESEWASILELEKRAGKILDYRYEALKLILADRTTLTPDFLIIEADGTLRLDECKGYMQEDANVKLKVAARLFPWFKIRLVRKAGKSGWRIDEVNT
jgi:hypothetical protein